MGFGYDFDAFFLPISIRQTSALGATAGLWSMRNTHATKTAMIKQIFIAPFTDSATPGIIHYELRRFNTATPTGGSALTPVRMRTSSVWVSCITDARTVDSGLTTAGLVYEAPFAVIRSGGVGEHPMLINMHDTERMWPGFELRPGEGLIIFLMTTATVGQGLSGYVFWDERL